MKNDNFVISRESAISNLRCLLDDAARLRRWFKASPDARDLVSNKGALTQAFCRLLCSFTVDARLKNGGPSIDDVYDSGWALVEQVSEMPLDEVDYKKCERLVEDLLTSILNYKGKENVA